MAERLGPQHLGPTGRDSEGRGSATVSDSALKDGPRLSSAGGEMFEIVIVI